MKQKMILMAIACVLLSTVAVFAQSKTDFSGDWTLDISKSKLPEMMRIESGAIKVTQTEKEFSFTTDFKRTPPPAESNAGGGGGMGRGNGPGTPPPPLVYSLDGKETSVDMPGPGGATVPVKLKTEWDGGKLKLTSKRTFNTPNGEMTAITKETWEVVEGGKALKRVVESESPRGKSTAEFYFTKK